MAARDVTVYFSYQLELGVPVALGSAVFGSLLIAAVVMRSGRGFFIFLFKGFLFFGRKVQARFNYKVPVVGNNFLC